MRAGLISKKPYQSGVNFKETEEVAFRFGDSNSHQLAFLKLFHVALRGGEGVFSYEGNPFFYIKADCWNIPSLPTGIFLENK
jgi:hypothetical protein